MPRSRFVSNTTALGVAAALTTLFTFAQVKILAGTLTREGFGLFASLRGLALLFSMLAANGLPQLLTRYLPAHQARGERASALRLGLLSLLIASVMLVPCIAVVHLFEASIFADAGPETAGGAFLFWFYATTVGVALKLVIYGGFSGLRRMDSQVAVETVSMAVQIAWLVAERDALSVAVAFRIVGSVSLLSVVLGLPWFLFQTARDAAPPAADAGPDRPRYVRYWIGATGLSLVAMAFTDVDRYILSHVIAFEVLSLFHIASRVAHLAKRFLGLPALAFQPEVTRLDSQGRPEDVILSTRVFTKFNVVASVLTAAMIIAYAPEIIRIIASSEYLGAYWLVVMFALSIPLSAMTAPLTSVMKARDEVTAAFWCDFAWAASYVISIVVLTSVMGIIGAGIATLLAGVVQLSTAILMSRLPLPDRIPASTLLRSTVGSAIAFGPVAVVSAHWPLSDATHWLVKFVLVVPALLLFRWTMSIGSVFSDDESKRLDAVLSGRGLKAIAGLLLKR